MNQKTASSRIKAHALEALVGGVLGAGAGGAGSLMANSGPVEWTDEDGGVRSRPLTLEEKQKRRQLLSRAMLIGTLGGAAASTGAAAVKRGVTSRAERAAASTVADEYLKPFRRVVSQLEAAGKASKPRPSHYRPNAARAELAASVAKKRQGKADAAKKLLEEQEAAVQKALGAARQSRRRSAWGGRLRTKARTSAQSTGADERNMWSPHQSRTHQGRVDRHFLDLRERLNLPPLRSSKDMSGEGFWRAYVNEMLEKRSSVFTEAFLLELGVCLEAS